MTREEIIDLFRSENREITERVATNTLLYKWCKLADKDVCARTRCIVDTDGTTISTSEDDQSFNLPDKIAKFFDVDSYPGSGITYNDKRIDEKTMAQLDQESANWRNRASGTPKAYYRRGPNIYLDRPIDSNADDLKVYAVLISDDFDDNDKTPYNQLTYLEPYHYAIVAYLKWKGKIKIGKPSDAKNAFNEYADYTKWMRKMLGGGKYSTINFQKNSAYS